MTIGTNNRRQSRVYLGVASEAVGSVLEQPSVDLGARERLISLFDGHHARLYRLARRLVTSPDDARDLVQDTFLRAARSPAAIPEGEGPAEAWLVRVLVNLCRDQWRRRKTRREFETRLASSEQPAISGSAEASVVARHTIWRALHALDPRRRAVIVLHELEDVAIADVARLLGVTAVTVRWHLSIGRKELQRALSTSKGGLP